MRYLTVRVLLIFLGLVFLLLQYKLWFERGGLLQMWRFEKQINMQQQKVNVLAVRNQAEENKVRGTQENNKAVVESRARNELGMVKQGETFYRIIKVPQKTSKKD